MREQQAGGLASDLLSELQALFVCGRGWGYCKGAQGGWEDPPAGRWTGCSSSWLPADSWAGCWSRSGPPADSWAGCWWSGGGLPADSWVGSWLSQGGSGQLRILMRPTSKQLRGLMRIWESPPADSWAGCWLMWPPADSWVAISCLECDGQLVHRCVGVTLPGPTLRKPIPSELVFEIFFGRSPVAAKDGSS